MENDESNVRYDFQEPYTQIKTVDGVADWENSEAYQEYLGFIIAIGDCIKGRKITDDVSISPCCSRLISLLKKIRGFMDEFPPHEMQTRYGNPAYREWFSKLESSAEELVVEVLSEEGKDLVRAKVELVPYLVNGFGNKTRIDYGTGHEMTFVMFLCSLFKIGALKDSDKAAVGLKVFTEYIILCRDLQTIYRMEPAGSMGVWNLDDYQFVAFIWGAAQLCDKARIKPKSIPDPEIADMLCKENHFFACLAYIHSVKSGPFHEHSNQLWNISGVPLWPKVFSGLIKMYRAEVLCKFPVMQHTLFGSIFTLEKASKKNPDIPEYSAPAERPGVPGVDSPRPGATMMSRLPGQAVPEIGLPSGPGQNSLRGVKIPPTACPVPGIRAPGAMPVTQFPKADFNAQFQSSNMITRLPSPDFQTSNP